MSKQTPLTRRVVVALLMVLTTGCQTWRPTFVSPQELIPARPPSVRATLRSGETATLDNPTMRNDSIWGSTDAGTAGVAAGDVGLLEVRHTSTLRTIGLVYLLAGVAFPLALVVTAGLTGGQICC